MPRVQHLKPNAEVIMGDDRYTIETRRGGLYQLRHKVSGELCLRRRNQFKDARRVKARTS